MNIYEKYDKYKTKVCEYYNAVLLSKNEEEMEKALKKYSEYLIKQNKIAFFWEFQAKIIF